MPNKEVVKNRLVLSPRIRFWILGIVVFCIYGKALKFNFVGLDDQELILDNYAYISDLSNLPTAFTTHAFYNPNGSAGSNVYYRPLLTISLMLDAQFSGRSPKGYHLSNIFFHIISCLLILKLLVKLKISPDLAFAAAMLFAVHPVLTQAVSWIPGRNDTLLTIFVCGGFVFLIDYLQTKNSLSLFLHFLFFGLSIFTKESAIAFPAMGILFLFLFGGAYARSGVLKNVLILLSGYAVVLSPWFFLRHHMMVNSTADLSFLSLTNSFIENLPLYLQFIQKSILPFSLSILSVPRDTNYILSVVLVLVLSFLLMRSKDKDWRKIVFGILWFSAFLLPGFVVHILTGFEHRVYLPLIGILLIVSEIDLVKKFALSQMRSILAAASVLLVFTVITVSHENSFSNNYEFWKKAAENSKHSALARMNYGLALSQNGETEKAVSVYKEGLLINSEEPLIHNNLGIVYARKKMFNEAEREFRSEIEINPAFSDAHFNLGILYEQMGKDSLMVKMWEKAIAVNPRNAGAIKALEKFRKHR